MHTLGMVVWQVRKNTTSISFFGFGFGAKLGFFPANGIILWMEKILHHLGWLKPHMTSGQFHLNHH